MTELDFGTVARNKTDARESPVFMLHGMSGYWQCQIDGEGTLVEQSMTLYENGIDVSATKLSGSLSVSGRTIKSKVIGAIVGGSVYKAYVYFKDDDVATVREFTIIGLKYGEKPSHYPAGQDRYRVLESPILIYPGQSATYDLVVDGQGEIEASSPAPVMYVYKKFSDDSANVLNGSIGVGARTIGLKTISNLAGGSEYIAYILFTDNGKATWRYFEIICPKLGVY